MNLLNCIQNLACPQGVFGTKRLAGIKPLAEIKKENEAREESKEEKEKEGKEGLPIDAEKKPQEEKARFPERPKDAPKGKDFMQSLEGLSRDDREKKIYEAISSGNMPDFLRDMKPVEYETTDASGVKHKVRTYVMPDYLAVGSNDDFVRMPMSPETAQLLADKFNCVMPTKKIIDQVHIHGKQVPMKIYNDVVQRLGVPFEEAFPWQKDPKTGEMVRGQNGKLMMSNAFYQTQDQLTNEALAKAEHRMGEIVSGIKKELIITERLLNSGGALAFTGGMKPDGSFYQNGEVTHEQTYADYSHGCRLISKYVEVDGKQMDMVSLMADPNLYKLVSDDRISNAMAFYRRAGDAVPAGPPVAEPSTGGPGGESAPAGAPPAEAPPAAATGESPTAPTGTADEPQIPYAPEPAVYGGAAPSGAPAQQSAPAAAQESAATQPAPITPAGPSAGPTSKASEPEPSLTSLSEQREAVPAKTVFVLGDSLSDGYAHLLGGYHVVKTNPKDKSKSQGQFTTEMITTFNEKIKPNKNLEGCTLVINGGSNDLFNPEIREQTKKNLSAIYKMAKELGMKVVAMTLPPLAFSDYSENGWKTIRASAPKYAGLTYEQYNSDLIARWRDLNKWILSQKGLVDNSSGRQVGPDEVVEFHEIFQDKDKPGKLRQDLWGEGGVHMSNYKPMAEQIRNGIAKANSNGENTQKTG